MCGCRVFNIIISDVRALGAQRLKKRMTTNRQFRIVLCVCVCAA